MALITKIKTVYSEVIAALGFTPENAVNKGQPNGYAGLDAGGRVPSAQLPSYVDDVQEYANLAAFPNPGAAGIIYLALDTNIIYRWSGSTYIEIASGDVAWADVTGKPTFGTMSSQDANSVNITGGTANVTSSVIGNLSLATNQITSTQASDDILITPTGIGALKVQNRITLEDRLSFGPLDPQGSYFANNAEYLQAGPLSAWSYLQNGTATKVEYDNGAAMSISNAASGNAGDLILGWTEVLNISSAGNFVTGNWTAGIIDSNYGGTGVDNNGNTLTITANSTISGTNTGDQTITLTGDVSGSGSGSFATTLANTTVTAGTYGNATQAPQITIDSKGRATSAGNVTITPAWASVTGTPTTISGYGITDGVTLTGAQTLTNKTVTDATFSIQDETDNSKKAKFELSGIATATTRTYTLPNVNGTLITDQEYTANDVLTKIKTVDGAGSGLDADLLHGLPLSTQISSNGPAWPSIPFIKASGVMEVGRYIDFHASSVEGQDYTARLDAGGATTSRVLFLPVNSGTLISTGGDGVVSNTMLAQITTANKVANSATTATDANTANAIVARDASGNFSAANITLNGQIISPKIGLGTITSPVNSIDTSGNILVNGEDTFIGIDAQTNPRLGMIKEFGFGPKMAYSAFADFVITQSDADDINPVNVGAFTDRFKIDTTGKVGINQSASLTEQLEVVGNVEANRFYAIGAGSATANQGQIFLNGATSNRIDFNANGLASPTTTTRSAGTKILFRNTISAGTLDYAIGMAADTFWFTGQNTTTFFTYYTGSNVAARFGNVGASIRGPVYEGNSGITTQNTGVTLTIAQILTLVIQSTPTANITFTLPTGTLTDAGVLTSLENNRSFTWSVVNLATGFTITMAGATGMTYVGNTTIAASTSASFRTIKTATNTFTTYRI